MLLRSIITVPLAVSLMACSTGCASFQKKKKSVPPVRKPAFVGTISLVNAESKFVLIDNGLLPTPPSGMELRSFTNGAVSAELVTSIAQRRPFTIADIRSGEPQKGDRVFVASGSEPAAQPAGEPGDTTGPAVQTVPGAPPDLPDFLPPIQLAPTP